MRDIDEFSECEPELPLPAPLGLLAPDRSLPVGPFDSNCRPSPMTTATMSGRACQPGTPCRLLLSARTRQNGEVVGVPRGGRRSQARSWALRNDWDLPPRSVTNIPVFLRVGAVSYTHLTLPTKRIV